MRSKDRALVASPTSSRQIIPDPRGLIFSGVKLQSVISLKRSDICSAFVSVSDLALKRCESCTDEQMPNKHTDKQTPA